MIVKCGVVALFLVGLSFVEAQNEQTVRDLAKNPFFNKFFEEFQKQYEQLQNEKVTTTPSPPADLFQQTTHHTRIRPTTGSPVINPSNPFFSGTEAPIRPTRRPHVNPFFTNSEKITTDSIRPTRRPHVNPFFSNSDSVSNIPPRPTRRPHINPFFTTPASQTIEDASVPQNTFIGLRNKEEESTNTQEDSPILRIVKKIQDESPSQSPDHQQNFLSFVQTALASPSQPTQSQRRNFAQTAPSLVKKLVNIAPRYRGEGASEPQADVAPRFTNLAPQRVTPEVQPRFPEGAPLKSRNSSPVSKLRAEDSFNEDEFKKQAANAKYMFASDVQDDINGNVHQRQESREGNKVTGMYTYEDGFYRRTVHYEADEKGYRVVKEDVQEIGDGPKINPKGAAQVQSYVAGNVVNYQITNKDIIGRQQPIQYQGIENYEPEYSENN